MSVSLCVCVCVCVCISVCVSVCVIGPELFAENPGKSDTTHVDGTVMRRGCHLRFSCVHLARLSSG